MDPEAVGGSLGGRRRRPHSDGPPWLDAVACGIAVPAALLRTVGRTLDRLGIAPGQGGVR